MSADAIYRRSDGSVVCASATFTKTMDASCWTTDGIYIGRVPLSELAPLNRKARLKFRALGIPFTEPT